MVVQKEIDLNKPLDANAAPVLAKTTLKPELSKAAIVLHGDRYKQLQAKLTKYVLWHPISIVVYTTVLPVVVGYALWDYISISDNLIEFYHIMMKEKKDFIFSFFTAFPLFASVFASFGFLAYIVGEDMGIITSKFYAQKYCDYIFGFDIKSYSQNETGKDKKLTRKSLDTQLIVYRDSPIAICSLVVDETQSSAANFIVKITGIHVRKVFQKVNFDEVLIDWAVVRARELYQEFPTSKNIKTPPENSSILITIDAYSFDNAFEKTLYNHGFRILDSSFELNPFSPAVSWYKERLYRFLNVSRDTFGLMLTIAKDDIESINSDTKQNNQSKIKKRH